MQTNIKIFSGTGFNETGPFFIIDEIIDRTVKRLEYNIIGARFTITPQTAKYCIGRYDLKTFESFPCPHMTSLTNKKENICYECFKFNGFNPSFYNVPVGQLSIKQREYNLSPHIIYLALFSNSRVKVGISNKKRFETRWLEQGARIATVLYECPDAYQAREIELMVSEKLRVSETFRNEDKRQYIREHLDLNKAVSYLNEIRDQIAHLIEKDLIETNYTYLDKRYLDTNSISNDIIDLTDDKVSTISGIASGLIGNVLIFTNNNQQFMFSLKKVLSHQITFNDTVVRQDFTPVQTSLF